MFKRDPPVPAQDRSVTVTGNNEGDIFTGDIHADAVFITLAEPQPAQPLSAEDLRRIAGHLLRAGTPPSLLPLFPSASKQARQSLSDLAGTATTGVEAAMVCSRRHSFITALASAMLVRERLRP